MPKFDSSWKNRTVNELIEVLTSNGFSVAGMGNQQAIDKIHIVIDGRRNIVVPFRAHGRLTAEEFRIALVCAGIVDDIEYNQKPH